ncbi:hypothetical protein B0H14DRAFT_3868619 [Mycena olivaceomarginata]|nr:hypothetical protein B0H14DRAFT_3868619 [Mycena olivaceomarginata]
MHPANIQDPAMLESSPSSTNSQTRPIQMSQDRFCTAQRMEDADAPKLTGEQRLAHLLGFWMSSESGVSMACASFARATIPPASPRRRCRLRTRPTSTGQHRSTPATGTQPTRVRAPAPLAGVLPAPAFAHSYSYPPRRSSSTNRPPHPHPKRVFCVLPILTRLHTLRRVPGLSVPIRLHAHTRPNVHAAPTAGGLRGPSHPRQCPCPCPHARAPRGEGSNRGEEDVAYQGVVCLPRLCILRALYVGIRSSSVPGGV